MKPNRVSNERRGVSNYFSHVSVMFGSWVFASLIFLLPFAARSDCSPPASVAPDDILCTDIDANGVRSGSGDDTVTVLSDATINVQITSHVADASSPVSVIAIDSGSGNDTIINFGSVLAGLVADIVSPVNATGTPPMTVQGYGAWYQLIATGIILGNGADYAGNHGSLVVTAQLNSFVPVQAGNFSQAPGAVPFAIEALGITGGNGSDIMENTGQLTVSATDNSGTNATSAEGISSGGGRDIITNTGGITVTASSALPILLPQTMGSQLATVNSSKIPHNKNQQLPKVTAIGIDAASAKDVVITNSGSLLVKSSSDGGVAKAEAQGIVAGNGKDVIFNDGYISVSSEVLQSDIAITQSLTGGDDVSTINTLNAYSAGIDSGNGSDVITNAGTLRSQAVAEQKSLNVELNLADTSHADTSVSLNSKSIGISSGNANDIVTNTGTINANATSRLNSVNVEVNGADAGLADSRNQLDASAAALMTGGGNDTIATSGLISASATSQMLEVGVNVSYADVTIADREGSDTSTHLYSCATGIDSGSGNDNIYIDSGNVISNAFSDVLSVGVSIASEGVPSSTESLFIDGSLANVGIESYSHTTAVSAGQGNDEIYNYGNVTSNAIANSTQTGVNVGIALIDFVVPTPGLVLGGGGTSAAATSLGMDAGQGNDVVNNVGSLDVDAKSDASSTIVSVNLAELSIGGIDEVPGLGGAVVAADTTTTATSNATGITGGDGHDVIDNSGNIDVYADAHSSSTAASTGLGIQVGKGDDALQIDAILARAETQSDATASGINGVDGKDTISNSGDMIVNSLAETDALGIGIDISGTLRASGGAVAATLTDTSSTSTANSVGIDGGADDDTIVNTGSLAVGATADTNNINVSATMGFVQKGLVAGAALGRSETEGYASATGIDGGAGKDTISNDGTLNVNAKSDTDSVVVSVTLGGTAQGLAAGAALADGGATAIANATGIRGGDNTLNNAVDKKGCQQQQNNSQCQGGKKSASKLSPEIVNNNSIVVGAAANTHSTNVSADVQIAKQGAAIGAALADNSATADAVSIGIESDDDDNVIVNNGNIQLKSDALAQAVSVGVSVQGTSSGLSAGAALTNASVNANSSASGIQSGGGDDVLINSGSIQSGSATEQQVQSSATAVGVSVASQLTLEAGASLGAALADTDAKAVTQLTAVDGEQGNDKLINRGTIDLQNAAANADAVSVSVDVALAANGLAAGAAIANSDSTAELDARGLLGGDGKDVLVNELNIDMHNMNADADAVSVSLAVSGAEAGVTLSGALVNAQATATAGATALDGGGDEDFLLNKGTIGIDGIHADTDAVGVSVGFSFAGEGVAASAALAKSGATSNANATAMNGGAADDKLINDGSITLNNIDANADAVSVSVAGAGTSAGVALAAGLTDASGRASANVSGMDGGSGDDYLLNNNAITVSNVDSDAKATGISISAQFSAGGVAGGASIANTSAVANTLVTGMAGGEGDDRIANNGSIALEGAATADATSVSLKISAAVGVGGGAALTDASSTAQSTVLGLDGGAGQDDINNQGDIAVSSNAATESTAASVGITVAVGGDVTLADAKSTAAATAVGIYDPAETADSLVDKQSVSVPHSPKHKQQPINEVVNKGSIISLAIADSEGLAISGNLLGYALGETTNVSSADAAGIRYLQGPALIYNEATISSSSSATADGLSVAVTLGGAAVGDTSTTANAYASGIESGAGDDQIVTRSEGEEPAINVDARSNASGDVVSVGLVGVAQADASNTANATATGINSGAGNDVIVNDAIMNISAGNPLAADGSGNCSVAGGGACSQSFGLSITLAGYGSVDGTSISNANALGITAGEGDDVVKSEKAITVTSLARAKANSIGISLIGASDATANTIANANSIGLSGAEGDDKLINAANLTVMSGAETNAHSFSLTIAGSAAADADTTTNANATGMMGGAGDDKLINDSSMSVNAGAHSNADGTAVTIFGEASASADTTTNARSVGMDGGVDNDVIVNTENGSIDICAKTQSQANASAWNFAGSASAAATLGALTESYGLAGGDGDDYIVNAGDINIDTQSWLSANSHGKNIFGNAEAGAKITADAQAVGIDAGADNDSIENLGGINANAYANMQADSTAASFIGSAATSEFVTAEANAAAIANSSGHITVYNEGEAIANVSAVARTKGSASADLGGNTKASGTVGAEVSVAGIDGENGSGDIFNMGTIAASASGQSWATHSSEAGVFFSDGGVVALSHAGLNADGIVLGDGENAVKNSGNIEVQVSTGSGDYDGDGITEGILARARADGGDFDIFTGNGDASGRVEASGEIAMNGIRLGSGDNQILNKGHISVKTAADGVKATAYTNPNSKGVKIDGDGWGEAYTTLNLQAGGIISGDGKLRLKNTGTIDVAVAPIASSVVVADAGSSGDTDVFVDARVSSQAVGITAGDGEHWLLNRGNISVSNAAVASVNGYANGNGIDGDGRVGYGIELSQKPGYAQVDAVTTGIDLGLGRSLLVQAGSLSLYDATSSHARAYADSDFTGEANGYARSKIDSNVYAIRARGEHSWIEHSGVINIDAASSTDSTASGRASGDGSRAWGTALTHSQLDSGVFGILAEGDDSYVVNSGSILINANPDIASTSNAESNLDGDSRSRATSTMNFTASGIKTSGLASTVKQHGDIDINIAASGTASTWSHADGALGDTRAIAASRTELNARGVGVEVTNGLCKLSNDGAINVATTVSTLSRTDTEAPGYPKGVENNWSLATAESFGVLTGAGENGLAITNSGTISVAASSVAQVSTVGSTYMHTEELASSHAIGIYAVGETNFSVLNTGSIIATASAASDWNDLGLSPVAEAVAIRTGNGDDTIINYGSIDTSSSVNGVTSLGIAIDAGAGNDSVILGDGSITNGNIDLGSGNDTLYMEGTPVINGSIIDDMSSLTLSFNNGGQYDGALPGHRAEKNGDGTFILQTLPQLDYLAVNGGTLQLNNDYVFQENSEFRATLYGNGSNGQFLLTGSASLAGQMEIVRGHGIYHNGTTYDVLNAENGIAAGTAFNAVTLPEDKPLLSFQLQQSGNVLQVQANVESFTKVAQSKNDMVVAKYLDTIAPSVDGALNDAIGEVQNLSNNGEFADAFYGLSPAAYDHFTLASFGTAQQYTNSITARMNNLQFSEMVAPRRRLNEGQIVLAANGELPQGLLARSGNDYKYGAYVRGFGQRGKQDVTTNNNGYEFTLRGLTLGLDNKYDNHYIVGASLGYANNNIDADKSTSSGDVDSSLASVYGSVLFDKGYMDAIMSYGRNKYSGHRRLVMGMSSTQLSSNHDGELFSLDVSGGLYYKAGDWWTRPFVSLQYTHLSEDSFSESGGATSLNVAARTTESLISQLGIRFLREYKTQSGYITPELSLAWLHDYAIDDSTISASYKGGPGTTFSIEGQAVEQNGVIAGAGFSYEAGSGYITTIKVISEYREAYKANTLIGELRYQF